MTSNTKVWLSVGGVAVVLTVALILIARKAKKVNDTVLNTGNLDITLPTGIVAPGYGAAIIDNKGNQGNINNQLGIKTVPGKGTGIEGQTAGGVAVEQGQA